MDPRNDLQTSSQWGRLNVHYRDSDSDAIRPAKTASGPRVKRHASDTRATRKAPPKRTTVCRHESERRSTMTAKNSSTPMLNSRTPSGSYSRMPVMRQESDLRKKKVAFADTPPVVMNDSPPVDFRLESLRESQSSASFTENAADQTTERKPYKRETRDEEKEPMTPKERRRRKVVLAVICTTFLLLTASALFVLITLFNASAIDEAVRKENENMVQSTVAISGADVSHTVSTTMTSISAIIDAAEAVHANSSNPNLSTST